MNSRRIISENAPACIHRLDINVMQAEGKFIAAQSVAGFAPLLVPQRSVPNAALLDDSNG
jgi:hypothetical protein